MTTSADTNVSGPNRARRLLGAGATGIVAALVLEVLQVGGNAADLVVLGTAVVVGELLELSPSDRARLPLSLALIVVLVRAATPTEFAIVVGAALLIAAVLRAEPAAPRARALVLVERLAQGGAALGVYHAIADGSDGRAGVLAALAGAALVQLAIADVMTIRRHGQVAGWRARGADLALVTSGMLMAVGYRGIGGEGRLGLWGPLLFSVPLLAAWYSFELLGSTQRNFRQTVRALGAAPALGGLARPGHVERVADLSVAMAHELELGAGEIGHLETAALLHHLGSVCLDEPEAGATHDATEVARSGAAMLRVNETLAPAGDIVASELLLHRPRDTEPSSPASLAGQILKVASAYDELTEGDGAHAAWAVEALYTGPGYVYDGRVLGALERVLRERGALVSAES